MIKFGIGQPVRRKEDDRLLTGKGRFVDDVNLPGQAYAAFLRSPHAHARLARVDAAAAKSAPGVLAGYTGDEVEAAFAKAARVVRVRLPISRVAIASIEPRGLAAEYDAKSERYTVHIGSQGAMGMRDLLAGGLGVKKEQVRAVTGDVGGSFGMK